MTSVWVWVCVVYVYANECTHLSAWGNQRRMPTAFFCPSLSYSFKMEPVTEAHSLLLWPDWLTDWPLNVLAKHWSYRHAQLGFLARGWFFFFLFLYLPNLATVLWFEWDWPHRLVCLNPITGTIWEALGGVSLRVNFEISDAQAQSESVYLSVLCVMMCWVPVPLPPAWESEYRALQTRSHLLPAILVID